MKLISFLLIFALVTALYLPSLNYYFLQDDWFVLNWVQTQDFRSLLGFRSDIIYWRPLSMPLLFLLAKKLFALNPLGYHLIAFSIFFALIFAIYKLFLTLGFSRKLSLTTSFFYGIWPIHFISLSWFSTTSYIIGPLFQVISFIFFVKFITEKRKLFFYISFVSFMFGITSSEFTLVLPLIFLTWGFLINKNNYLKFIAPYLLICLVYLMVRFFVFPLPAKGDYQLFLNKQIVNNLIWYIAWAIGLPERFKSLIFIRHPEQSIKVLTEFWAITIPAFLLSILLIRQLLTSFQKNLKVYVFGILWFSIGILPVISLANHSFPMYLSLSGLGFLFVIAILLKNTSKIIWVFIVILWTLISFTNLQFTKTTHWIINEQAVSKAYVNFAKKIVPTPPKGSIFYFRPADVEFAVRHHFFLVETEDTLRQSLADQNASQVIYNEPSLKSFYSSHQNIIDFPKDLIVFEIYPKKTDD